MLTGLKKFLLHLLSSEIVAPLVWVAVFGSTLIGGRYLFGQEYGLYVGGICGIVFASVVTYIVTKRIPYGHATDLR